MDERELLSKFVAESSGEAFAELVRRNADLVYSAARRQLGDSHLAEDVTQAVFVLLARKAASVKGLLAGWLINTTVYACRDARKLASRREFHEQQAAQMRSDQTQTAEEARWEGYAPALDEAMARLNRPSVFVYGGTILPGCITGDPRKLDVVSVFEAIGAHANKKISDAEFLAVEQCAIPGAGACGGMYTANTMASAIEALGMSLPNSSAQNAISPAKLDDCRRAGAAVVEMLRRGIKPLDILTKKAFENAITVVIALGGSTNAVLHLLAIAHAAKVKLTIDDFTRIGKCVPVLADLKPSGKHLMSELIAIGGIRPLMKMLLDKKLLHGETLTVTGETMAETLRDVKPYPAWQKIIQPFDQPIKKNSHIVIMRGNLAADGAVAKISGKEGLQFSGKAIVFESEEKAMKAILNGTVKKGHVIVIRYEGPKGGPGMREMLSPTAAIMGKGLGKDVTLITDGRFSGGSHGFVVGHITPEAYMGGTIALVKNGDTITIDAEKRELTLAIPAKELAARRQAWKKPAPRYTRGVLAKYAAHVTSASLGAVTDDDLKL